MTERLRHHPQNIGVSHAFIPSLKLQSKNRSLHRPSTASWAGEFFDRIAFFVVYPTTICNITWVNVCPILVSATDSSSGNNCHAVHRSLSSGASVYECIMGFTLSHFISQIHPHDLFRLLAIGMCHFLPVHHFVMACLLGPKVKIQHDYFIDFIRRRVLYRFLLITSFKMVAWISIKFERNTHRHGKSSDEGLHNKSNNVEID